MRHDLSTVSPPTTVTADPDATRDRYLREAEQWAFDPSEWERATVAAVLKLPEVKARRLPPPRIDALGMVAKQCHDNALRFAAGVRGARVVTGWLRSRRVLTLHSVVEVSGDFLCVTPTPAAAGRNVRFVPDPAIHWEGEPCRSRAIRDGHPIGIGVRLYAQYDSAWFRTVVARLRSGMNPDEAIAIPGIVSAAAGGAERPVARASGRRSGGR